MDRVYFDSPISPAGQDWMHCEVRSTVNNVLRVTVQSGGYGHGTIMGPPWSFRWLGCTELNTAIAGGSYG